MDSPTEDPLELDVDDIRRRANAVLSDLITQAERILASGTTANKISLMKSTIPVLMRELQAQKDKDANDERRQEFEALLGQLRTQIKGWE